MWEDDDFSEEDEPILTVRIFRAWEEKWDKNQFNSQGDEVMAAKYCGLKWFDIDKKKMARTQGLRKATNERTGLGILYLGCI